jgi:enoyl-CoA hydratase/carnithine racemase
MTIMTDEILLKVVDGIGVITFNRPESLNTFTQGLFNGLGEAYRVFDEDDEVKVIVITGAGMAFCAGADMSGGGDTFDTPEKSDFSTLPLSMQAWDVRKPVIAACNGHAVGVGLGVASQCDLRVFAQEGKYGFLQNRRGVVADFAIEHVLPRLIGFERAFEMIVGAAHISGEQAGQWGLASRVVPAIDVLDTAMTIARDMAKNCSPLVMGLHKKLLWAGQNISRDELGKLETKLLLHSMGKPDAIEGGRAFFEKRAPVWTSSVNDDWPDWLE